MERKQHIRLCHVCGHLNEGEGEVEIRRCVKCTKAFLPVDYFEKMRKRAIASGTATAEVPRNAFNPLNGLLVFW